MQSQGSKKFLWGWKSRGTGLQGAFTHRAGAFALRAKMRGEDEAYPNGEGSNDLQKSPTASMEERSFDNNK